jgi:hypothetical protein
VDPLSEADANLHTQPLRRTSVPPRTANRAIPVVRLASEPDEPACPRCGGKLTNPETLGWCPRCGYCRSLQKDAAQAALAKEPGNQKPSVLGMREFFDVLAKTPPWMRVLAAGVAVLVGLSLAVDFLTPEECLPRALWSVVQLVVGLVGLVTAQIWAFIRIAPNEERMGVGDLIMTGRLWALTVRRLPEMRRQVWLGAWGVVAMLTAVLLVGGFGYWWQFYKPKKIAPADDVVGFVRKAKAKSKSLEQAVEDFAGNPDIDDDDDMDPIEPKKDPEPTDPNRDNRPTVRTLIIGYTLGEQQELTGLVLATEQDDLIRYAGVVKRGFTPANSKELLEKLAPLVRPKPLIPNLEITAIWVRLGVACRVHQSGFDDEGLLVDPNFNSVVVPEKQQPAPKPDP